ncbi:MAG: hypothetical protein Q8K86_07830 [Candidatus Nanopelagicaceae bacterium]|nr:hypothetical protein [Candidatus Nanopelagicaceae bacterium]
MIRNTVVIGEPWLNPRKSGESEDNCLMRKSTSLTPRPRTDVLIQKIRRGVVVTLVLALISIVIPPLAQATYTIFGPFPVMTATYGSGTMKIVHPTTNSPGAWSYTSSNTSIAKVSGDILQILSVGTTTITATQAASGTYNERSRATQLRVSPGTPTVGSFPSQTVAITARVFTLAAPTSTASGDWSFSSSNPTIAAVSGNQVTLLDGGTVLITATQRATLNWISVSKSMTLTIDANKPVLGPFGSITIMKDSVASLSLVTPSSNSTGAWTFTNSNPAVARLVGNVVTPLAFGSTVITATQAAIGGFSSASTSMTLTIKGTPPTLGSFPNATTAYDLTTSHTVTLTPPTSNSTGSWSFVSSDSSVATINGATVTMMKPGQTLITAVQAASSTYGPSDPVTMTFTVTGAPTLGVWISIEKVVNDPDFTLTPPTSNSPGDWTLVSDNPSVVEIVGTTAKVKAAGLASITATQVATQFFAAATSQITVRVYGAIPTLGVFSPIAGAVGDLAITIKAPTSNSIGAWVFTSSNTKVSVVTGGTLKIVGVGTATLTATQKPNGIYSQSNTVQTTVTGKAAAAVGEFANLKITYGTIAPILVLPNSSSSAPWTFVSSNSAVVTFSGSIIQMRGIGTATITATQGATSGSPAVTRTFTIQVLVPSGPTPKPSTKPTPQPTTTPTSQPGTKPVVKVSVLNRVLTVSVTGASAAVTINGSKAKVGKNTLKPGLYIVIVSIAKKIVFSKTYRIK